MVVGNSRARTALAMICVVLAALRFNELAWVLPLLAWLLAIVGVHEMHALVRQHGAEFSAPVAFVGATALVGCGLVDAGAFPWLVVAVLGAWVVCVFIEQIVLRGSRKSLTSVPAHFFSVVYVALPLACGLQILRLDRFFLLFVLLAIWSLDSAAYYIGCAIGRHKMAPEISPKKSWEGAVAGLVGCMAACVLQRALFPLALSWREVFELGLIFGVVGQVGDLAESGLKRDAGVKDSGSSFLGHGGVLDRMDSLLFCFIACYLYLVIRNAF